MKPLAAFSEEQARALAGVVFDLDDTLLDHGALGEDAYRALFRLRETGLRLIACTGRPAGWAKLFVRTWPIDAAVAENGAAFATRNADGSVAVACASSSREQDGSGKALGHDGVRKQPLDRAELVALGDRLLARFPDAAFADDNAERATDVTLDIGEHRRVRAEDVVAMRAICREAGIATHVSSVHLHLAPAPNDKGSGALELLARTFGDDATAARFRYGYIGDSENDGAAFATFDATFGVANVRAHLGRLSVPPRFVASLPMGAGFAEIAARIVALRSAAGPHRT